MATHISPLAAVDPAAQIGENVTIGPFCLLGPHVTLGDGCVLDSHVAITGHTTIGAGNRFWPGCVIGGEPQDKSFHGEGITRIEIGRDNQFREGVTVNRGANKEDGVTRIGFRRDEVTKRRADGSTYQAHRSVRISRKTGKEI